MPDIAQTADEAFDRYKSFLGNNALIQSGWHGRGDDGRELACGLGALGPDVNGPKDCPAQIMPLWLAQMVPWFFDNQEFGPAKEWGLRFYAELKRLGGVVPLSVVHDWQATVVGPLAVETAEKQKRSVEAHKALMAMQAEAASGKKFAADDWRPVLKAAFYDIYSYRYRANAYAYTEADAEAAAVANAYTYANAEAAVYANPDAYANAYADADADADAYANADADAYRSRIKQLADGMVECLSRVGA